MATQPTNLPVPSETPRDLKFNAGKIDEFVTSLAQQYLDRFGNRHYTIEGLRWVAQQAIATFGYVTLKSFQLGAPLPNNELTLPNQVLQDETDGEYYRWDGVLPKSVPSGSTPQNSGGVGPGKWLNVGDASLRSDLKSGDMTDLIGYPGYDSLTEFLQTNIRTIDEFKEPGYTDAQTFQTAVYAGSVRLPAGTTIDIIGNVDINIPADRLIVVDYGATLKSNGRFTAYGVNNVHWIINGVVECTGMASAPAKSGWPNTAAGTQAGDERGFIEFGGVVFAGNDGDNYSVKGTGHVQGPWSGTPNVDDLVNQLNRKGIAAWNCSNYRVEGITIDGFEGEQVYWFSRNINNRNAVFEGITSSNARFNALNLNAFNATFGIRINNCHTKNSYNGIESSSGDITNTTHEGWVHTGILFGLGSGGGNRLIDSNMVYEGPGTAYSLLYNKDYEARGYVPNVTVTNNVAVKPGNNFIVVSGISGIKVSNNTCYGLVSGRFIQATYIQGGVIEGNTNYKPEAGTEHIYRAECYSLRVAGNELVNLGGSYVALASDEHAINGGYSSAVTTYGNRENFIDVRSDNPAVGTGGEYRYSMDKGIKFTPITLSAQMIGYSAAGATADWSINNLKLNPGDTLGQSWVSRSTGHWEPGTDGTQNLGRSDRRINNSYFAVAPTVTSDENAKTDLFVIEDKEKAAALEIKQNIRKYKLMDAIALKGESASRWHFGVGAQTVGEIMRKHGLNPGDYGFWCHDVWDDVYTPVMNKIHTGEMAPNEEGVLTPVYELIPTGDSVLTRLAGESYGVRYDELAMFVMSAM